MAKEYETLSIEQRIGQLFVIGIAGPELDVDTLELLADISPGGICLFARNIREASQTRDLTNGLRMALPIDPIIAIDQEGGLVDRLRRILSPMPAADQIQTREDARWLAEVVAQALLIIGVNVDFAPVVDVSGDNRTSSSNGLTSRIFGSSQEETVNLAGEFLRVLQSAGIVGCLKHFPGLGASTVDSHEELPLVNVSQDELYSIDLYPYRSLMADAGVNAVMIGHAAYPSTALQEYDQNGRLLPSSLSANFITGLLRNELGYDGIVITDDLEMGAIVRNYGIGEACVRAVAAGADMVAICADPHAIRIGYKSVLDAVGGGRLEIERIDESVARVARVKEILTQPSPFNVQDLENLSVKISTFAHHAALT